MSTTLDFQLREALPHLSKNARLNVLVALILHANIRNRCYPSLDLLCVETGFGLEAVNKAKSWLIECGAIERVPYGQRVGKEKKLPPRQNVYQLTGVIKIDGKSHAYLYDESSRIPSVNPSDTETSVIETSVSEDEVVPSLKNIHKKRKEPVAASDEARAITLESSSVEALSEDATQGPAEEAAAPRLRSVRQQANDEANAMLIRALGDAWGVPAAKPDEKDYLIIARKLVAGTVPMAEFGWYVQYQKRVAKDGRYTLETLWAIVAKGRISNYVEARNTYRAKQEAGEVTGPFNGQTPTTYYHKPAVIVPETDTVSADALRIFQEASHD